MASGGRKRKGEGVSLPDLIKETLECPVCQKTITDPPVFLCEKGHELCNPCREQLKSEGKPCPVCRGKLIDARSWAVEKLLKKLPQKRCKNNGCNFERSDEQLVKKHEADECTRRPVKCEFCHEAVALLCLHDHLISKHQKRPIPLVRDFQGITGHRAFQSDVQQASLSISPYGVGNTQHPLAKVFSVPFPGRDLGFFYNWQQLGMLNLTMFWVSSDGTQKEAENYQYTLEILDPQDHSECLFLAERPCVSCDVSHEKMKECASAILLDKALLERASKVNEVVERSFDWRLTIRRM